MDLYDRYMEYYKPLLRQFCNDLTDRYPKEDFDGIPHPFIPSWGKRYEMSHIKMAFIGKETAGWSPNLPDYISDIQQELWNSSFDISEFQNLDYVDWSRGRRIHRYTFWGFVLYLLASLYGIKNWTILKRREAPYKNILNCFLWGNALSVESEQSIRKRKNSIKSQAYQCARAASIRLNDYQHIQSLFNPDIAIVMCGKKECNDYLFNTEKTIVWDQDTVRLWKPANGSIILNVPHPNRMRFKRGGGGADYYVQTISQALIENGFSFSFPELQQ